jgi:hypothetical protein
MAIIFTDGQSLYDFYQQVRKLDNVNVTKEALEEFVKLVGGEDKSERTTRRIAENEFTILKKVTMTKIPPLPLPTMLSIKDNDGNIAVVKTNKFLTSMTDYIKEFGYETVTEKEVRKNLHKICMLGEVEKLDVVGHLVKSHLSESEFGAYSNLVTKD